MEKLLHERLREGLENLVGGTFLLDTDSGGCVIYGEPARQIADEIERYYIPRPRFEDGEPVQFGDKVEGCFGCIHEITVFDDGSGIVHGIDDQDYEGVVFSETEDPDRFGNIKRHTPKVYDADRVAYEVGHYVYSVENGLKWRVVDIFDKDESDDSPEIKCHRDVEEGWKSGEPKDCILPPNKFTHERPVFDAEGVRICEGDTVWLGGEKYTVKFPRAGTGKTFFKEGGYCNPEDLTHREPDSPERIIHDICEYCKLGSTDTCDAAEFLAKIADRAALIERGA